MEIIVADNIVNRILSLWDEEVTDEATIIKTIQSEFELSMDDAEMALELTQTGLFRAQIICTGNSYPANNLNDNPIVRSAIKIGPTKLGRPELYTLATRKNKPWWKFL